MPGVLFNSLTAQVPQYYQLKKKAEAAEGRKLTNSEFEELYSETLTRGGSTLPDTGTSIFDPNLAELNYAWFSRPSDEIFDPFAGGSVRGIVAHVMGRHYTGIELRSEQVDANITNAQETLEGDLPTWIIGDSLQMDSLLPEDYQADFILTCPPYGDLETYSDDPRDISNMNPGDFDATYAQIIAKAAERLRPNRFATIVVGNYRHGKDGLLRSLYSLTVEAAEAAGLSFYNDMVLRTNAGSLPIRVRRMMESSRKVGRTHQYVLNFVKGSPTEATARLESIAPAPSLPEATARELYFTAQQHDIVELLDSHPDPAGLITQLIREKALA